MGQQSCAQLLIDFKKKRLELRGEKIKFTGVGDKDVYNITAPFFDQGELIIAGRVESRDSEEDSAVRFFVEKHGQWQPRLNAPVYKLQDPFITRIAGELIFGGVKVFPHPEKDGALSWRTQFFKGKTIDRLHNFTSGPGGMKDLRLLELADGRIGLFTRPQGEIGGRGTIGFIILDSLDQLNIENINKAKLLNNQFIAEEWGGVNQAHLLKNGLIGVLGHIACFTKDRNRHYYPVVFAYDPGTGETSQMEIIATRGCFPEGPAKKIDLVDVVFSGGLVRKRDRLADLYVGVSDTESHQITIADPFCQYENS